MRYFLIVSFLLMIGNFFLINPMKAKEKERVVSVFAHGIVDTGAQVNNYIKNADNPAKPYIISGPYVSFDFPDAMEPIWGIIKFLKFWQCSLGQDNEIETLKQVHEKVDQKNIVGIGLSRGSAVWVNFAAKYQPKNLRALVIISCYDKLESILQSLTKKLYLSWIPYIDPIVHYLASIIFTKYKRDGIHPINSAQNMPTDIPILLICSAQDTTVPAECTRKLYAKLREKNKKVHLLQVDHGKHAKIINDTDGTWLQNVVHAFYKKYGLPHNKEFAKTGEAFFDK